MYSATSRTIAGWFSLPRCGTGARYANRFHQQAVKGAHNARIAQLFCITERYNTGKRDIEPHTAAYPQSPFSAKQCSTPPQSVTFLRVKLPAYQRGITSMHTTGLLFLTDTNMIAERRLLTCFGFWRRNNPARFHPSPPPLPAAVCAAPRRRNFHPDLTIRQEKQRCHSVPPARAYRDTVVSWQPQGKLHARRFLPAHRPHFYAAFDNPAIKVAMGVD